MKSSTAAPSFRNSGLLHMWKGWRACLLTAVPTFAAVPTGTVDLVTITSSRAHPSVLRLPLTSGALRFAG